MHQQDSTHTCPIDCRTAKTPQSQCECGCGGRNHGKQSQIQQYEVESVETHPFESVSITENGVKQIQKRESIASSDTHSLPDINVGDTIRAFFDTPKDGWKGMPCSVEDIRRNNIIVRKPDGYTTRVSPDQVPVSGL